MRPALQGSPTAVRIGVPEEWVPWITARADQMVEELKALGGQVDVVGSVEDLRAQVESATLPPDKVTDTELLEAALKAWTRQLQAIEVEVDERNAARRQRRQRARKEQEAAEQTLRRRLRRKAGAVGRRVLRPVLSPPAPGGCAIWLRPTPRSRSATRYRRVAVVGNAPMEPSEHRAAQIDDSDLVIRVNSFVAGQGRRAADPGPRADVVLWSRLVKATPVSVPGLPRAAVRAAGADADVRPS